MAMKTKNYFLTLLLALRNFSRTVRRLADVTNPVSNWVENPDQNAVTLTLPAAVATGVNFNMMPVTGGVFYMGESINPAHPNHGTLNVTPVHQVGVSSFYMSQTLVTRDLFHAVMNANGTFNGQPLTPIAGPWHNATANIPEGSASWFDAVVFANRLSVIMGRDTVYSHDSLAGFSIGITIAPDGRSSCKCSVSIIRSLGENSLPKNPP